MNPALLIGAGAVLLLAGGGKKKRSSGRRARSCPPLQPGGGHIAGFDYIEIATGGAQLTDRLPIIVFFHSLGSKPEGFIKYFQDMPERARVIFPRGRETYGSGPAWWTLRSRTEDQDGLAAVMDSESKAMVEFVETVNDCLGGVGRPIITGHSQGGMMTYAVAAASPRSVKAAVPVAGWLPVKLWPRSMPPTTAIHGTADRTVDYARTEDFVKRAQSAGLPIDWIPIEGKAHGFGGGSKDAWFNAIRLLIEGIAEAAA
jgi:phospholipase/carboxylesterase